MNKKPSNTAVSVGYKGKTTPPEISVALMMDWTNTANKYLIFNEILFFVAI
jgi:hypothetical protein